MDILYLILTVLSSSSVTIFSSLFIKKNPIHKNSGLLVNFLLSLMPFLCWAIYYAIEGGFEPLVLLYSLGYAISFVGAFVLLHFALDCGPLSLTTLIVQMSLVFTAVWGLIFWNAKASAFTIIGLILIAVSLFLCIFKKDKTKKFNLKWLLLSVLCCVANASATIIVKSEQVQFDNKYGGEMMFFAFIVIVILCACLYLWKRKIVEISNLRTTWWIPLVIGLCNFLLNLFVILLAKTSLSPAIIYPTIAVGSLACNIIFGFVVNKEKLTIVQFVGLIVGAVAIAFLSL